MASESFSLTDEDTMETYEFIISKELGNRVIQFVDRVRAENTEDAKNIAVKNNPELLNAELHVAIVSSSMLRTK